MEKQTNSTFRSVILESASRYADKHALSFVGEEGYTYSDAFKRTEALAALLEKLGISKGDKVALIGPNSPDWVISYLAVVYLGAIIVPILHDFSPEEVQSILEHSEAKAIITDNKTDASIKDYPSNLQYIISLNDYSFMRNSGGQAVFTEGEKPALENELDAGELAAIIYTS
ncbi:MAG: acyl--CoA ligase, partial [Bacteroidales bacterium]|nr:acyl--CoA ligase [Bacteroidales bacterium]